MELEEENRLLRGVVVDSNTDIDAYLEVRKENEHLKQVNQRLVERLRENQAKLSQERKRHSIAEFIRGLFR